MARKQGMGGWGELEADKRGSDSGLDLNGGSNVRSIGVQGACLLKVSCVGLVGF